MGSSRPKPCLGFSLTCDCSMCRARRLRGLERAAMVEERARELRQWDEEEGRVPPPPPPRVPLREAAVRAPEWREFWQSVARYVRANSTTTDESPTAENRGSAPRRPSTG
ncbi:hypothetical protein JRI60_26925 [Archangium violaceum]|uniref:hypothetical protein n=1 Tax=Archangium violaceum TaxID=83451 RepID=UPI00194EFD3E|nr:hypothetical protein [Archangium violaceum]QRN92846.1 hypothetical protein JRI60_26925 [Archangium violaceum]